MKLAPGDLALARCLTVKAESLTKFLFRASTRPIDFVAQNQNGTVCQLKKKINQRNLYGQS
jgi:hypothetical protein